MRTVIYARYSTDHQNSRSIDDQIAVCRLRAEREGWPIIGVFGDEAISGAAGIDEGQRPGFHAMMQALNTGGVDQVMTESTSRLFRDEGDSYEVRRWLTFYNVRLFTLADGVVTPMSGSLRAIVDAQQRRDTAANVKRGQYGTVTGGRIAAGKAYGYRIANRIDQNGQIERGLREVDQDQAEVVRRIFESYAKGMSCRAIAIALNEDGIASPSGRKWTQSTLLGDRKRGSGILKNELYIGRIVHFRTHKVTHPQTRNTLIRPNAGEDRVTGEAPHLRIIDDALWETVQTGLAKRSHGPKEHHRRPKKLLSGLMRCGLCGGSIILIKADTWACSSHRHGKGCTNNRYIMNGRAEDTVLNGLQDELAEPDVVDSYLQEYAARRAERATALTREKEQLRAGIRERVNKIERLALAMANGADEFQEVKDLMYQARAEREQMQRKLDAIEQIQPVALHPGIARNYRLQIGALGEALKDPAKMAEAAPKIRALVETVIATPAKVGRGLELKIAPRMENILRMAAGEPPHERTEPAVTTRTVVNG